MLSQNGGFYLRLYRLFFFNESLPPADTLFNCSSLCFLIIICTVFFFFLENGKSKAQHFETSADQYATALTFNFYL